MREKILNKNGITLIALVITIIVLLLLAGVAIATLTGENGLFARAKQAKVAQTESDMKESLNLAIQELQVEKLTEATLDDITQEWIEKIEGYESTIQEDSSISGKKAIMKNWILDEAEERGSAKGEARGEVNGRRKAWASSIRHMRLTRNMTEEEAFEMLNVPQDERSKVKAMLEE